jgi:hypothetical protein
VVGIVAKTPPERAVFVPTGAEEVGVTAGAELATIAAELAPPVATGAAPVAATPAR